MPTKAHCPRCAGYEDAVMRKKEGETLAAHVKPCGAYVMSDRFRDWAVERMRAEVGGSVSAAGLDRMALLKAKPPTSATERTVRRSDVSPNDEPGASSRGSVENGHSER